MDDLFAIGMEVETTQPIYLTTKDQFGWISSTRVSEEYVGEIIGEARQDDGVWYEVSFECGLVWWVREDRLRVTLPDDENPDYPMPGL